MRSRPGFFSRLFSRPAGEEQAQPRVIAASGATDTPPTPLAPPQAALAAVRGTTAERVLGTYEAAQWSANRSALIGWVQGPEADLDEGTRLEIVRRARYQEKNSPIFQRVLDLLEVNIVGTGLLPTPSSSDPEWNFQAKAFFENWAREASLDGRETFAGLQAQIVRAMAVDGEIFAYLARDGEGVPRVQLLETHRIGSAALRPETLDSFTRAGLRERCGLALDDYGRTAGYLCAQLGLHSLYLPASRVTHFAEPARAGQLRGLSLFHACLTTLQDLHELQSLEMLCAKSAALNAFVFKRKSGEADPEAGADSYGELTARKAAWSAAGYSPERAAALRQAVGGQTVFLAEGEDLAQTENERPSAAMREFWEYLVSLVARSVGLSRAALHDYEGWSGPALRGAIVADNRFYQVRTAALTDRLQRIYEHVVAWGIDHGKFVGTPPPDWRATRWHAPRRPTIDVGRDSAALLNELHAGVRTRREVQGEMGLDWREVATQQLVELAFIQAEAGRLGLPPSLVAQVLGLKPTTTPPEPTPQPAPPTP